METNPALKLICISTSMAQQLKHHHHHPLGFSLRFSNLYST